MRIELFINHQKADLPANPTITLQYRSNILGDISKFQNSFSYSFKLPKTARNARILDDPGNVAHESEWTHKALPAVLICDGTDVLGTGATAVLLSVGDEYEVSLLWDRIGALTKWLESDPSIKDLAKIGIVWSREYTAYADFATAPKSIFLPSYDAGIDLDRFTDYACHPAVSLFYLFDAIFTKIGVAYTMPDDYKRALQYMAMPLPTRNRLFDNSAKTFTLQSFTTTVLSTENFDVKVIPATYQDKGGNYDSAAKMFIVQTAASEVQVNISLIMGVTVNARVDASKGNDMVIVGVAEDGTEQDITSWPIDVTIENKPGGYSGPPSTLDVSDTVKLTGYKNYYFKLTNSYSWDKNRVLVFSVTPQYNTVYLGQEFTTYNLPDISQVALVKAVCALYNLAMTPGESGVSFAPRKDLFNQAISSQRSVDWSDKLIGGKDPTEVGFTVEGYEAQKNWFRWKANKFRDTDADGAIDINDTTLPAEQDMYTLPFAATETYTGKTDLYAKKYSSGKWSPALQSNEPLLMQVTNDGGNCALRFSSEELWSQKLENPDYLPMADALASPTVIKCRLNLSPLDLQGLDYSRAIYLRQYGAHFALISLRTDSKGNSEAELLKLTYYG
jgi:hypothetical protein